MPPPDRTNAVFICDNGNDSMKFDPTAYGPAVAAILALDGNAEALTKIDTAGASSLFPNSRAPQAALSGLYLYFSCIDKAHEVAQSVESSDGAYWHGIVHRQEPDRSEERRVGKE